MRAGHHGTQRAFRLATNGGMFYSGFVSPYSTKTYCVRFEDIKTNPRRSIMRLCRAIDIEFNEEMMESTFNGLPFVYTGSSGKVTGFTTQNLKKDYSSVFNWFDKFRIEIMFSSYYRAWGYSIREFQHWRIAVNINSYLLWIPFRADSVDAFSFLWQVLKRRIGIRGNYSHIQTYIGHRRYLVNRNRLNLERGHIESLARAVTNDPSFDD